LVDYITITSQEAAEVQDLPSIFERHADYFPVGVALDERETVGAAAELTTRHFNQITAENHMKVEAWFSGNSWDDRQFGIHPQAEALMDFAQDNDMGMYGHTLVWHSQTPSWFYADANGDPLTNSEADKQIMRDRMEEHIEDVARLLSEEYGLFGSEGNPLVAWDVINEVVSDSGEHEDGLRRSEWYRILGEEFIDLSFIYADRYFNDVYAAPGTDRPVTLFINDYNTELSGKQNRYYSLIERLLERDVPIDGVGHQFHVSLSLPVQNLDQTIERFRDFDLLQAVTELDVTVGEPVTDANIIEQGYYYRDAFESFRSHADVLYSVSIWGLTDNRSWRSAQAPLVFDAGLQAKPAYFGLMGDADSLVPRVRTALAFQGEVGLDSFDAIEWQTLPLNDVDFSAAFQTRWSGDQLTVYVAVDGAEDSVTFSVEGDETTVERGADNGTQATQEDGDIWEAIVQLPLAAEGAIGDELEFDVTVGDASWGDEGATGTLTLVEELSFTEIPEATVAPEIDGEIDDVWNDASVVTTGRTVEGSASTNATANVSLLWEE
ncbi:glycoside hydrolase, partial [Cellulomonas bogoriensis 69B4 = DSM 16987]